MNDYKKHVILYIDALGSQERYKEKENFGKILKLLNYLKCFENTKETKTVETKEGDSYDEITRTFKAISFSDLLVISSMIEESDEEEICAKIIGIARTYAQIVQPAILDGEFIFRGAMVIGELHHESNIIFGPGLVEAYEMESKRAIHPRVIVAQEIYKKIQKHIQTQSFVPTKNQREELFRQDEDGEYYINFFSHIQQLNFNKVNTVIENNIRKIEEKCNKWGWLKRKLNQFKDDLV